MFWSAFPYVFILLSFQSPITSLPRICTGPLVYQKATMVLAGWEKHGNFVSLLKFRSFKVSIRYPWLHKSSQKAMLGLVLERSLNYLRKHGKSPWVVVKSGDTRSAPLKDKSRILSGNPVHPTDFSLACFCFSLCRDEVPLTVLKSSLQ